jgi:hypothetical protein
MRIYIVAGTIGSGITEVCTELRMETFRKGYRAGRLVIEDQTEFLSMGINPPKMLSTEFNFL